jgi:pimeloyl-ACP methyl ester carboxylesterase
MKPAESRGHGYPQVSIPADGTPEWETNPLLIGDRTVWILPPGEFRAVALVLHGLNLKPSRMNELCDILIKEGTAVLRGTLTGHSAAFGDPGRLARIDEKTWAADCRAFSEAAAVRSRELGVPLFFVGYSLGSLVALDTARRYPSVRFDRMVHFAPALSPRLATHLVRLLGRQRSITSRSLPAYRVHDELPAAVYHALLDSARNLRVSRYSSVNVPTLAFIDPRDELVSLRALRDIVTREELRQWTIREVEAGRNGIYHHLLVAPASCAPGEYTRMRNEMIEFLFGQPE